MTAKLSENMKNLLRRSEPGVQVSHGPTRAALIRRGLVYRMDSGSEKVGTLTLYGVAWRNSLLAADELAEELELAEVQS